MTLPLSYYSEYRANITILIAENETIHEEQFDSPQAFDKFIRKYCRSRKPCGVVRSLLIPVRTNFKDFYKDLFFPTVVNRASTIHHLAKKIFLILLSLVADILTFPARLVTFIPRAMYNAAEKMHPLCKYLIQQKNISEASLGEGLLIIKLQEKISLRVTDRLIDVSLQGFEEGDFNQLDEAGQDKVIDFFSMKYFCDPTWNRDTHPLPGPSQLPFSGEEPWKFVHTEKIERDLRWREIPHSSWQLKADIATKIYLQNDDGKWEKEREYLYPINYREYAE